MLNQFSRTQLLVGEGAIKKLSESRVAVLGIGGVGGYSLHLRIPSSALKGCTAVPCQ